ncbi:MAG: FliH/SctL family protein [Candidatus Margulisiibacteriota bacterium]
MTVIKRKSKPSTTFAAPFLSVPHDLGLSTAVLRNRPMSQKTVLAEVKTARHAAPPVPKYEPAPLPGPTEESSPHQEPSLDPQWVAQQVQQAVATEKEAVLRRAYEDGFAQGRADAEATLKSQSEELLSEIAGLSEEKREVIRAAQREILQLALKIAEQILRSEISLNPAVTANIVSEAIEKATNRDEVIVHVNPQDISYMETTRERLQQYMRDIKRLAFEADNSVDSGGCIVETKMGFIDATVTTKLENIKRALGKAQDELEASGDTADAL